VAFFAFFAAFFTLGFSFSGLCGVFIALLSAASNRAVASLVLYSFFGSFDMSNPSKPGPIKECAFCGARVKLTEEHIFAEWLAPYLPSGNFHEHTVSQTIRNLTHNVSRVFWREGDLHRRSNPKNSTLKIVCEQCNTVWMSRLQTQVKPILLPMLQGRWPEINSPWERRILAAWAVMFTMVVEFADLNTQATSFSEREYLRLVLAPPNGWYVWIGLHKGPLWRAGSNHFGWANPIMLADERPETLAAALAAHHKPTVQCTGWVVGPVYFQTISSSNRGFKVDELTFAKRHGLRVVWPSDNLPIERPVDVLDDIAADNVSKALLPEWVSRSTLRRAWEIWTK
jgi:hypothetical protein